MSHQLSFAQLHQYDAGQPGISLDVALVLANKTVQVSAKLDTGATDCIFARQYGEQLGLTIESGEPIRVSTPTGIFVAFRHTLTLVVLGYSFVIGACFAQDEAFQRNVLGRHGFLEQVRLGLVDYEGQLYLSSYDE